VNIDFFEMVFAYFLFYIISLQFYLLKITLYCLTQSLKMDVATFLYFQSFYFYTLLAYFQKEVTTHLSFDLDKLNLDKLA